MLGSEVLRGARSAGISGLSVPLGGAARIFASPATLVEAHHLSHGSPAWA